MKIPFSVWFRPFSVGLFARPSLAHRLTGGFLLILSAVAIASMALTPVLFPYHPRIQSLYLMTVPVSVGWMIGKVLPDWSRRRLSFILVGTAVVFSAALYTRLQSHLPPLYLAAMFAAALILTVVYTRLGLAQAGIPWSTPHKDPPLLVTQRTAFAFMAFTWILMFWAMFVPSEQSPPTRLLLTLALDKPGRQAATAVLPIRQQGVSGQPLQAVRLTVPGEVYRFDVGRVQAKPDTILATVSVRRVDGHAFGKPVWLTVEALDPQVAPQPVQNQTPERARLNPRTMTGRASTEFIKETRINTLVQFSAVPARSRIRLRGKLWVRENQAPGPSADFRKVAEADLGAWDLTPLRWLRPQPVMLESASVPATK